MSGQHGHEDITALIEQRATEAAADINSLAERIGTLEQVDTAAPAGRTFGARGPLLEVTGANLVITTPGTLLADLDIYARVIVKAPGVRIRNCVIRGGATTGTLIEAWDPACTDLIVEDTTLAVDTPGLKSQGIHGHGYTLRRCDISRVVDGAGAFGDDAGTGLARVLIEDTYIHDLHCWTPDPSHSDNITHSDCIQLHGGGDVTIRRNVLIAQPGPTSAASVGATSCVMITPHATGRPIPGAIIEDNLMDGGAACINASGDASTTLRIRRNRFGRHGSTRSGAETVRITADKTLTAPDLPTTSGLDIAGNVYAATGLPVRVRRTN